MTKIKLTFLGTSDAIPTAERNHSAIFLEYDGEHILIDCGEGTQRQFRKARLNPCSVTRILISHWHGDHILGLPGILQTMALSGYQKTLYIYGPKGTKNFMNELFNFFVFVDKFPIKVYESEGKFFENKEFELHAERMEHGTPCNAYAFAHKGHRNIDTAKLKKLKIPAGQHLKFLKEGKDMHYQGRVYKAKDLTYVQPDKRVAIVMDTKMNPRIEPFVKNADIFICESSFSSALKEKAEEYRHMTVEQVATIAKKAGVKKLFLTHISQRHALEHKKILQEAKKIFKNTELAEDFMKIEV
jgi:ribonuclease Z